MKKCFKGLLFVFTLALILNAAAQGSLVADGDFERADLKIGRSQDKGGWSAFSHGDSDACVVIAAGEGRNGSQGVRYKRTTAGTDNFHLDQIFSVARNTTYEISAWVRTDGRLNPVLSVMTMKWRVLAELPSNASSEWTRVTFLFNSSENDSVRFEWFPGSQGSLYQGMPGTSWLDDVSVRQLESVPAAVQRALDLSRSHINDEKDITKVHAGCVGDPLPLRPISCRDGVLLYPDGSEVALWGVNFQTALSWEYNGRLKKCNIPLDADTLKEITDRNLDELVRMQVRMIRMHLLPSDFSDAEGNVCDSVFLDVLDYTIAGCRKRGIYVYLTLINEMNGVYLKDSFMAGRDRREWITDPALVNKTERYVRSFLDRKNRYTDVSYSEEVAIALFEISNEPGYVDYKELSSDPLFDSYNKEFKSWCEAEKLSGNFHLHYRVFRYERVLAYINRMCAVIRSTGSSKPVAWNLNWPRFVQDHQDVYQAAADSNADAVSFCLYPGQSDVKNPYWKNPEDLSSKNYLPFLDRNAAEYHRLRWTLSKQFAGKAKLVYEYETFFNQSSYLYPAMARLFRSLGVQAANMWTYSLTPAAEHMSGPHLLNLYCTPEKAVSFTIAGELFAHTQRCLPFGYAGEDNRIFESCAVSFTNNVSLFQAGDVYMQSRASSWSPFAPDLSAQHVIACGSSPQVTYTGSGAYYVDINDSAIEIEINPDSEFVQAHWNTRRKGYPAKVCRLDSTKSHRFVLHHPEWQSGIRILRVEKGVSTSVNLINGKAEFIAQPGHYRIEKLN